MVNKKKSCGGSVTGDVASLPLFSEDDRLEGLPAAGYRNGDTLYNDGENGNYWSSTPNESNDNNAYNLYFNEGNRNVNWSNRNNGHSVRPVLELTSQSDVSPVRHFSISDEQLLLDLYRAYKDARKNKRGRSYQLGFEFSLEDNLVSLRDDLLAGTYKPAPATCFIIHDPKMREVFAAEFRDRIVHHLFYNYTHEVFERTFIYDSYSCIKGRGTHFGIERLKHHIRSVSAGYSRPCYVLKLDIRGYFMNIDRGRLLKISRDTLLRKRSRLPVDFHFVDYLLETIICSDPVENCHVLGSADDWNDLPVEKSLFHSAAGCGLPIGNLSSQLFSNVYMNVFDQYVKRGLKCRHYGRYVDDAYIVSGSLPHLKGMIPALASFLRDSLGLELSWDKIRIVDVRYGVEFLGAYIKPFRTYVSSSSLARMKNKLNAYNRGDLMSARHLQSSVNSFLGVLSHYDSYCVRRVLFGYQSGLQSSGQFDSLWLRFTPV